MQKPKFKDAISGMTAKQKREYVWGYYKMHILSVLTAFIMMGYLTYEFAQNRETHLNLVITGGVSSFEDVDELSKYLNKNLLTEEQRNTYRIEVSFLPFSVKDETPSIEHSQKLMILLAAGEIDFLITDIPTFENFQSQEFLLPLNQLEVDVSELKRHIWNDEVFGISTTEFELLSSTLSNEREWVLSVVTNSERINGVEEKLAYLVESR